MERQAREGFFLFVSVLMLVAVAKAVLYDNLDPDLFWHLRVADQIAAQKFPGPIIDEMSFASIRQPWTPYSWLAKLAFKHAWDSFGYRAAIFGAAAMAASLVYFMALAALELTVHLRGRARYFPALLATAAGEFLALPYLSFRPATLALTLLAIIAYLLQRDRRREGKSRAVWLV